MLVRIVAAPNRVELHMKRFKFLLPMLVVIIIVFGLRYSLEKFFGLRIPDLLYAIALMIAFAQIAKRYKIFAKKRP